MAQTKIHTPAELTTRAEEIREARQNYKARVLICMTGCRALGAADVASAFRGKLAAAKLDGIVEVVDTGCIGLCARAPVVLVEPYEYLYGGVKPDDVDEIIEATINNGEPVESLCVTRDGEVLPNISDIPFYNEQNKMVLANCGRINPKDIADAIARGGYEAAAKALCDMSPQQIIEQVTEAGLRGRGGGGFPTGTKWRFCREEPGDEKYLICNADEGDPGAFMDRAIKEGDPHRVIEGMVIGAYAIGANKGFVYVRAEYPIAVEHITIALAQARELGLLGRDIFGSGFDFDIDVRVGAGAFVCGEETALIASLEGKRGMPRPRPPFPTQEGYRDKPTVINNVETLANVPLIIKNGADWYSSVGTKGSKGTKIFALAGRVNNTGLVEVPMGTTLRQIVFDIGQGIPKGRKFKAAQMGGPSGGCVPPRFLDTEVDYDSVKQVGAIMGSGGLVVMDETTCAVDIARFFLRFVQNESCGKCTPCRVGTKEMLNILDAICEGRASIDELERLERLADHVARSSLCGLGQTAPNPVLSTLRYFRDEYEEHIVLKRCRAARCEALVSSPCRHACPAGVNAPEYVALAAEGKLDEAANVIRRRNPFVSVCGRVCDHPCEQRCRRSELDEPIAIRALKRYIADKMRDFSKPTAKPAAGEAEVAIVGAGPAGLSCAYFLALMGRRSTVFEAEPIPGGMLALGIPEYRLPKKTLKQEIDFIVSHGIELRTGRRIADVRSLLEDRYKAVFVATGAQTGRKLGVPGEDMTGVTDALELLRNRALGKAEPLTGRRVVVVGGGNAAVDAAGSALRLGADKVTILYRRSREEMPAYAEEIEQVLDEGVELQTLAIPNRVVGQNCVTGIEIVRAELGDAGEDGRRRPVPIEGSETVVECDLIVPAIGQIASTEPLLWEDGPELTRWGTVQVDPATVATSVEGVFAAGDCVTGGTTVIEAIAGGQRAAVNIDKFLGGTGQLPPDASFTFAAPDEAALSAAGARATEKSIRLDERKLNFHEVVLGLDESEATREAKRCLRCDLEQ
ncbi:MAG: FAD-dependent oxidoreductase [Phycisphaerales bacterium]|nr:MAG: FAD-dependent oxidoreductase [Phycisphaerales bacterium]